MRTFETSAKVFFCQNKETEEEGQATESQHLFINYFRLIQMLTRDFKTQRGPGSKTVQWEHLKMDIVYRLPRLF